MTTKLSQAVGFWTDKAFPYKSVLFLHSEMKSNDPIHLDSYLCKIQSQAVTPPAIASDSVPVPFHMETSISLNR